MCARAASSAGGFPARRACSISWQSIASPVTPKGSVMLPSRNVSRGSILHGPPCVARALHQHGSIMKTEPFRIEVSEGVLRDLRERLARTRFPDEVTDAGMTYGVDVAYMR